MHSPASHHTQTKNSGYERMNQQINEWLGMKLCWGHAIYMTEPTSERMNKRMNQCMNELVNEWMVWISIERIEEWWCDEVTIYIQ